MNKVVLLLCLLCACAYAKCHAVVQEYDQKYYTYDIGKIGGLEYRDTITGKRFTFDMCDGVDGCGSDVAICMTDDYNSGLSLGKLSTRDFVSLGTVPGQGVVAMFGQGDDCEEEQYSTSITISCDPEASEPRIEVNHDECYYEIGITSKWGCGKIHTSSDDDSDDSNGLRGGELAALIILLVLISSAVLYFAVGAVWQKVHGASSLPEYVIHHDFWFSLPGLVVDGCKFIRHGFKKGDYVAV